VTSEDLKNSFGTLVKGQFSQGGGVRGGGGRIEFEKQNFCRPRKVFLINIKNDTIPI